MVSRREPQRRATGSAAPTVLFFAVFILSFAIPARADFATASEGHTFYQGRRPDSLFSLDELRLVGDDLKYVFTSPARWNRGDWLEAGILTGSVAAVTPFDHGIKLVVQRNRNSSLDNFSNDFQQLGAGYSFAVLGAFEVTHWIDKDPRAQAVMIDGVSSSLIASGIITPVLKYTFGRARPNSTDKSNIFKPFSGNQSFPSGHTTQAFAVASVIAADYPQWWVQILSYGSATVVGLARIEQNAHWMSDVVAGATIGTVVGRAVVAHHNRTAHPNGFTVAPLFDGRRTGLVFSKDF